MTIEVMKQSLELLAVATFHSPELQAKRTKVIERGLQAIAEAANQKQSEPVAYIRKDQLQKAAQSPLLCEVTPEPRQDRIGIYTTPQPQEFVCSTGLCRFTLTQTNVGIGERGMEAYEAAKERGWVGVSDERLMEMPKQEQDKPVAWLISYPNDPDLGFWFAEGIGGEGCLSEPLYTKPQQRTWVGLADEEIADCMTWSIKETCKAIEAKLKQNNGYNT